MPEDQTELARILREVENSGQSEARAMAECIQEALVGLNAGENPTAYAYTMAGEFIAVALALRKRLYKLPNFRG